MVLVVIALLVAAYVIAASRAARRGAGILWLTAALALLVILGGAVALGRLYSVPNPNRLLLYALMLLGPSVVVVSAALTLAQAPRFAAVRPALAVLGAIVGLLCGFIASVYGLGVW